jgi:hypothetical protein
MRIQPGLKNSCSMLLFCWAGGYPETPGKSKHHDEGKDGTDNN